MVEFIKDGTGSGYLAKVGSDNRLRTYSKAASIQHIVSQEEQEAYQVIGTSDLTNGVTTALHLKNVSNNKSMVITYLRHQVVCASGGTTFPNKDNYFSVRLGRKYDKDGTECTPVNVYSGSGNTAEVLVYCDNPTLTGTANEIDRWYTKSDGDMNTFNKEGALIIPPNQTIEVSYVGDQTVGTIYTRLSFLMEEE